MKKPCFVNEELYTRKFSDVEGKTRQLAKDKIKTDYDNNYKPN